jgi:hypothetical protein
VNVAIGDGDVARRAGIDAIGVARGFGSHDFDTPGGEAVGLIDRDVEAGRVAESDFVENEVVRVAQGDHRGDALLLVSDLCLMREIPPADVLAEERGTAASIDGALAHDAGVGNAVAGDERLAAPAVLGDDAAGAGREIVDARIARGDKRGVLADNESDAGTESERAGEENIHLAVGSKNDGLRCRRCGVGGSGWARSAVIDRILNAGGGELLLIGEGDDAVISGDVGLKRDADVRNLWLGDGARVLRVKGEDSKKRKTDKPMSQRDEMHSIPPMSASQACVKPATGFAHFKWTEHLDHPMKKYRTLGRQGTAGINVWAAMRK